MISNINSSNVFNSNTFIWLCIGIISAWLFWAATIVGIETGDGYLTLTTSQYFLGINERYGFQRGPLLALYLVPAEWLSNIFHLHPLDVRLHHISTALLHSLYIIFVWLLLRHYYRDSDWLVAVAFLASIPSFVFFTYGIFISPDIFPGIILATMVILVVKFEKQEDWVVWITLVLLGFIAVAIKQTYALFWVSILIASFIYYSKRTNLLLFSAAALSGILSWLTYAWFVQDATTAQGTPWLLGPLEQINTVNTLYSRQSVDVKGIFTWWLYLRNFYNYGMLTATLIVPAILYSLFYIKNKNKTIQLMAVIWLACFSLLHIITFKEVRYLAFLAPLSAFLLVPFFRHAFKSKYKRGFILLIVITLAFDFSQNIREAMRVNQPFYQGLIKNFFKPLDTMYADSTFFQSKKKQVVIINHIGFTPNLFSPFKGDRYHRTFHLPSAIVYDLYDLKNVSYSSNFTIDGEDHIGVSHENFSEGDILIFSNQAPVREPPWDQLNLSNLDKNYIQIITVAEKISLSKKGDDFYLPSNFPESSPALLINSRNYSFMSTLIHSSIDKTALRKLIGEAIVQQDVIEIMGFRISRLCNNKACFDIDANGQRMY